MQLTSLIVIKKYALRGVFASLCITNIGYINFVFAESLTYSPDQWPRHWNVLMNKTNLQYRLNGYRANGRRENRKHINQSPIRSPMWGVAPATKQKPRRSVRPEYNTNAHMQNYYGQNVYQGNYYSGYGFTAPYVTPLISSYGVAPLAPGLAAPGIPFGVFPFMGGFPTMGRSPGMGYMW